VFGLRPEDEVEAETKARHHVLRLVPKGASRRGVRAEVRVVHSPDAAESIVAEARRRKADAIVMGTHGRGGLGRLLMGSVATDVLKEEVATVVLVHARGAR
jgi:nucleotide-binding universal stress UspA family protein